MVESKDAKHVHIQAEPKSVDVGEDRKSPSDERGGMEGRKKLDALYFEYTERIKQIMLDASPRLPKVTRKASEEEEGVPLKTTPSLEFALAKTHVCSTTGDDICDCCAAIDKKGQLGHYPWDELEMMKHGWMDNHGHHWGSAEPQDSVALLHSGVIDQEGHQTGEEPDPSTAALILKRKMSKDEIRQFMAGKVQFGSCNVVHIPLEEEEPGAVVRKESQTVVTIREDSSATISFDCYKVEGGEVTRVETSTKTATLLKCPDRLVYVERGEGEELLVAAHLVDSRLILNTIHHPPTN